MIANVSGETGRGGESEPGPLDESEPGPPHEVEPGSDARVPAEMRTAILEWYAQHGRRLAFRGTLDPYAILVSEAMAQQTQAPRAAEAWTGFLAAFPSLESLARATPADVLRAWRGLGYNRRALALRRTAVEAVHRHGGRLPEDVAALEALPGIGPYTARAVAALAFGLPVGAVDTNVRRVLTRSLIGVEPSAAGVRRRQLQVVADAAVPSDRPGEWTHALMDVGAVFCRPTAPRCEPCPALRWCRMGQRRTDQRPTGRRRTDQRPSAQHATAPGRELPRSRERAAPFRSTRRWLRGEIVDRLRDGSDGEWVSLPPRIGDHDAAAVTAALAALHRDGLAEPHPTRSLVARLPLA